YQLGIFSIKTAACGREMSQYFGLSKQQRMRRKKGIPLARKPEATSPVSYCRAKATLTVSGVITWVYVPID
ncbi:hypothetical protein, partial [Vibrio sp. V39_P1S14PM300]|uniref:hypothetical protein n=1 Tax=Vibrio sp. V39_P1S14PM300 TaxID=1938690 RepID=UPI001F2A5C51